MLKRLLIGLMSLMALPPDLLAAVCHQPNDPPPVQSVVKANYGHYWNTKASDAGTDLATLCETPGITGVVWHRSWSQMNASDGATDFTTVTAAVTGVLALIAASKNPACQLWVLVEYKSFASGSIQDNPVPLWVPDSNGNPGYYPNVDSGGALLVTGATNASPIAITAKADNGVTGTTPPGSGASNTSAANLSNGDRVYIAEVAGNTAANSRTTVSGNVGSAGRPEWTVANVVHSNGGAGTDDDTVTFTLTSSTGNGAYTSGGRIFINPVYTAKIYDATVRGKYVAFWQAMAAALDSNPRFEGVITQETALGLAGGPFGGVINNPNTPHFQPAGYTGPIFTDSLKQMIVGCAKAFTKSRCIFFANFIQGDQGGLGDVASAMLPATYTASTDPDGSIRAALKFNKVCISGPDILPGSSSLYQGGNVNRIYEILMRQAGCRSDSVQNDSYGVEGDDGNSDWYCNEVATTHNPANSNGGNGIPDCTMTDIFRFGVGSGIVPGSDGPTGPTYATWGDFNNTSPFNSGLCINSYFFWNHTTSPDPVTGLTFADAKPVIAANPYTNGPNHPWIDQCHGDTVGVP